MGLRVVGFLLLLFLLIAPNSFASQDNGKRVSHSDTTVVMLNGKVLTCSHVEVDRRLMVMQVLVDGSLRKINIGQIAYILDAGGSNITERLTGRPARSASPRYGGEAAERREVPGVALVKTTDGREFACTAMGVRENTDSLGIATQELDTTVHFDDVAAIWNASGEDITMATIGHGERLPDSGFESGDTLSGTASQDTRRALPWWSETDDEYKEARRTRWAFGIGINAGLNIPVGVYYDGFDPGMGFDAVLRIPLSHNLALRGSFGKAGAKVESPYSGSVWRYMVALDFYSLSKKGDPERLDQFYIYGGIGGVNSEIRLYTRSYSESKFAFTGGLGYIAMLSRAIGVDLGVCSNTMFIGSTGSDSTGEMQVAYHFTFHLGLVVLIPSN